MASVSPGERLSSSVTVVVPPTSTSLRTSHRLADERRERRAVFDGGRETRDLLYECFAVRCRWENHARGGKFHRVAKKPFPAARDDTCSVLKPD